MSADLDQDLTTLGICSNLSEPMCEHQAYHSRAHFQMKQEPCYEGAYATDLWFKKP
jgi:hypothetical protein